MKNQKFIKITVLNSDYTVDMTLNTNNIDSYIANHDDCIRGKCRLSVSSLKHDGCDIIYIMETKEHLDDLLT